MSSRTFTQSPYGWGLGDLGLLSLAAFIGSIIAFYFGGRLIDIISSRSATRHGGVRRPEYRLPAIMIPGVIGPAGILIFGLCVAHKTHWIGPAVGNAMQAFGVAAISNVAVTYSLDSYKPVRTSLPVPWETLTHSQSGDGRGSGDYIRHSQHDWHACIPLRGGMDRTSRPCGCLWGDGCHSSGQHLICHSPLHMGKFLKSLDLEVRTDEAVPGRVKFKDWFLIDSLPQCSRYVLVQIENGLFVHMICAHDPTPTWGHNLV